MSFDLLQSLQILTQLVVQSIGRELGELSVFDVPLSIEEPVGDLELARIVDDREQLFDLVLGQLTGPLRQVDVGLLAADVSKPPANSFDRRQGVHDVTLAVDVRVQHSQDVLELFRSHQLRCLRRCLRSSDRSSVTSIPQKVTHHVCGQQVYEMSIRCAERGDVSSSSRTGYGNQDQGSSPHVALCLLVCCLSLSFALF